MSSAEALNERGVALARRRRFREAADCFRQAIAADPAFAQSHNNLGHALAELGDLAGAKDCYERFLRLAPQSLDAHNDLGITLSRLGDFEAAVACYQRALKLSPNDAPTHNNLGIALAGLSRHAQAVAALKRAIELKPDFAEANNNLGMTFLEIGEYAEAVRCFERTLRLAPNYAEADNNLGATLARLGKFGEAQQHYERALELKPDYAEAHNNLGMLLTIFGRLDEAHTHYRQAIDLKPDYPNAHTNRALTMLLHGDFESGWQEYEWRLKSKANVRAVHAAPRWDGSPLGGRTLLLEAEQGMGDTIQFVRYAAQIKRQHEGRVIVACDPPLVPLLSGIAGPDVLVGQNASRPPFDVWAPLLSLPGLMHHDATTFPSHVPYLQADPSRVKKWKSRLADVAGLKIGIAWQGMKTHQTDQIRSFPLASFAPLGQLQGLTLISLQKGYGSEQLEALSEFYVLSLGDDFDAAGGAFLDTAAVMQSLDLVVSSDTSVAHLAGALGVPVWLALATVPDWRWGLCGEASPWYPTMRLFRQMRLGDWAGVFERIADALVAEHASLRRKQPAEFRLATSGFNRLARTRHGLMLYNRHDAYVGKSLEDLGEFSEGETDIFRQLVRPGATIVEAGANIGAHTVPLGRLAGENGVVHAIEPQRIIFQTLCANVALSSLTNVQCHHAAAGERRGWTLVPTLDFNRPNNFGGLSLGDYAVGDRVPVITVDGLALPRCDLVKVDVEGMELDVIRGAAETIQKFRPILYVENDRPEKSPALIEALVALGYKLYWHLPAYFSPTNYYGNRENPFGNVVSINMLGVHSSINANIQGLRAIDTPQSDWRRPG